jgi:hypothetical protein
MICFWTWGGRGGGGGARVGRLILLSIVARGAERPSPAPAMPRSDASTGLPPLTHCAAAIKSMIL